MFINCSQKVGTAYYELQYCKQTCPPYTATPKDYDFWYSDSLLVHIDDDKTFFAGYGKYLQSPDGQKEFDAFGVNYYSKAKTIEILQAIIEEQPTDWQILTKWLEKAVTDYNGFYFLGI